MWHQNRCWQIPFCLCYFAKTSDISQFELVRFPLFLMNIAHGSSSSVGDHRPLPVPHSTGATVSSSPQHRGSTSPPTNDVSSMSSDPTVTHTDSSLEAAAANASLGYCRWLSFPRLSGPVTPPPDPRKRPDTGSSPPPFSSFHIPSVHVVSSLAIS